MATAFTITVEASEHPFKSVTVFKSSKAEIVRNFALELKKGQNRIEIRGLSTFIDTQTVRVTGLGDARVYDFVCTRGDNKTTLPLPDSSAEIKRALQVKKAALESERAVIEQESKLLFHYAQTLKGDNITPSQMGNFLQRQAEVGRKNVLAVTNINEKIVDITRKIELEDSKSALKKGTAFGRVTIVIVADEDSAVEIKLTYIVSNVQWAPIYELHATAVNGKPYPSVSLHYRARVLQSTGEDWNNTTLTFSTNASDAVADHIPKLHPVKIRRINPHYGGSNFFLSDTTPSHKNEETNIFHQQLPVQRQQQHASEFRIGRGLRGGLHNPMSRSTCGFGAAAQSPSQQIGSLSGSFFSFGASAAPTQQADTSAAPQSGTEIHEGERERKRDFSASQTGEDEYEEVYGPGTISESTTIVSETPGAISFFVHGKSTIPSDGVEHQVSVAVLPFEATISYICIPRIDPRVFLQCVVKNTSEYRLLPGPVTVIFDDSYVSKTSINDVNTGDNFECTLGADASTKVTYLRTVNTVKSDRGAFYEITGITTYNTKISIYNKHQFEITDLVVRDVIPTCDDKEKVSVVLRTPAGLAEAKDGESVDLKDNVLRVGWESLVDGKGGAKEGKYEWKGTVGSGAKVNLEAEWDIRVPGGHA